MVSTSQLQNNTFPKYLRCFYKQNKSFPCFFFLFTQSNLQCSHLPMLVKVSPILENFSNLPQFHLYCTWKDACSNIHSQLTLNCSKLTFWKGHGIQVLLYQAGTMCAVELEIMCMMTKEDSSNVTMGEAGQAGSHVSSIKSHVNLRGRSCCWWAGNYVNLTIILVEAGQASSITVTIS
jgi:hypothetical protein